MRKLTYKNISLGFMVIYYTFSIIESILLARHYIPYNERHNPNYVIQYPLKYVIIICTFGTIGFLITGLILYYQDTNHRPFMSHIKAGVFLFFYTLIFGYLFSIHAPDFVASILGMLILTSFILLLFGFIFEAHDIEKHKNFLNK